MNKKFENDNFILYAPDSLDYKIDGMEEILKDKLELYKQLFNIDNFRKVQINYFDNIDTFRNFIHNLRGEKDSLPAYATGTFDKGMINTFIEPNILKDSFLYNKRRCSASHELFHIMYKELIWEKNKEDRIVWFDEGMAQLFSGESDSFLKKEKYDIFFKDEISNTKIIPNLNTLSHGYSFKTDDYNGYKLSLIAVKYIYDKLGMDEFKKLLYNSKEVYKYGNLILKEILKS